MVLRTARLLFLDQCEAACKEQAVVLEPNLIHGAPEHVLKVRPPSVSLGSSGDHGGID